MGRAAAFLRVVARVVLGGFLLVAGTAHLTFARAEFQAQVPRWMPVDADVVVVVSGVVEVALGLALLVWRSRRAAVGVVTALFFVAVFPGNLWQYLDGVPAFGLDTDAARLVRLFVQPVLVVWALWATGAWPFRPAIDPPDPAGGRSRGDVSGRGRRPPPIGDRCGSWSRPRRPGTRPSARG